MGGGMTLPWLQSPPWGTSPAMPELIKVLTISQTTNKRGGGGGVGEGLSALWRGGQRVAQNTPRCTPSRGHREADTRPAHRGPLPTG